MVVGVAPSQTMSSGARADFVPVAPQEDGDQDTEQCDQQKADNGLIQRDPYVQEYRAVYDHFIKAQSDPGGTAENEGINDSGIGADFPQDQKENENEHPRRAHDHSMAAQAGQEPFLFVGYFIHRDSAPSISH